MINHKSGLYIYAITNNNCSDIPEELSGIDNLHPLRSLPVEDFNVIISHVDLSEYGELAVKEHLQDMKWVKEKMHRHFEIIQFLSKEKLLLPMQFCTIFITEENLLNFLREYQESIKQAFFYFQDKEEWTIKLYCNYMDFIKQNMNEEKKALDRKSTELSPGKAYFLRKRNTLTLEEQTREKINAIKNNIWEELLAITEKTIINKNLSHQVSERTEEMLLNAAFLIKESNLHMLMLLSEKWDKSLADSNIFVELIGPWPFYNFTALFIREQNPGN